MIGTLGDIVFQVNSEAARTLRDESRTGAPRYVEHDIHGAKPRSEFNGPGLDSISLTVDLSRNVGIIGLEPIDELKKIRKYRDEGQVLTLILGGQNEGDFTIRDTAEERRIRSRDGELVSASVTLTLREYL
jgi:phage protein U